MKRTHGRWLTALLLVAASTVIALALGEIALRTLASRTLLQPDMPDFSWMLYNPVNGMINKAGFHQHNPRITRSHLFGELRINARGFRGDEVIVPKPEGIVRVVCLGDSSSGCGWPPVSLGRRTRTSESTTIIRDPWNKFSIDAGTITSR